MDMQQALTVIGAASAVASAIFWGAFQLGKMRSDIDRLDRKVEDHDQAIRIFKRVPL